MKCSEVIALLQKAIAEHGDLRCCVYGDADSEDVTGVELTTLGDHCYRAKDIQEDEKIIRFY